MLFRSADILQLAGPVEAFHWKTIVEGRFEALTLTVPLAPFRLQKFLIGLNLNLHQIGETHRIMNLCIIFSFCPRNHKAFASDDIDLSSTFNRGLLDAAVLDDGREKPSNFLT